MPACNVIPMERPINTEGMNKRWFVILSVIFTMSGQFVSGQGTMDTIGGVVTYKTTQNIYVRFESTKDIAAGDTLYIVQEGMIVPMMEIKFTSSTSCVGSPLSEKDLKPGDRIIAKIKTKQSIQPTQNEPLQDIAATIIGVQADNEETQAIIKEEQKKPTRQTEKLRGRISAASYVNFSDHPEYDQQKMRYTMTFNADRIGNTKLSAESYLSFRHTINEWQEVKDHFKKAICPNGESLIVHTSNFRKVKRVLDVIKIFANIHSEIPAKLLMIGDGPERTKAETMCRDLDISHDVRFLGKLEAVEEVLSVADLFLMPSEKESFGLAALEAMACEVPVISSNTGGLPELNVQGVTGFLSPVGDVEDMTRKSLFVLDKNNLPKFKENALKRAKEFEVKLIVCLCKHMGNSKYWVLFERLEVLKEWHEQGLLNSVEFLRG